MDLDLSQINDNMIVVYQFVPMNVIFIGYGLLPRVFNYLNTEDKGK
jgi:hypothetical protein